MLIIFVCSRNHSLSVDPSLAGKRVRCPLCQEVLVAPMAAPVASVPVADRPTSMPGGAGQPPSIPPSPVPPMPPVPPAWAPVPSLDLKTAVKAAHPPPQPTAASPPEGILPLAGEQSQASAQSAPLAIFAPPVTGAEFTAHAPAAPTLLSADAVAPNTLAYAISDDSPRAVGRRLEFLGNLLQRKGRRQQIESVKSGLAFHYWKYLLSIISVLLIESGILLLTVPFPPWIGLFAVMVGFIGHVASPMLGLAGSVFCMQAPEKTGARPFILASLALDCAAWMVALLSLCTAIFIGISAIFLSLASFLDLTSFILFIMFLRAMAEFVNDPGSVGEATSIIVSLVIITLGGFVGVAFAAAFFHWMLGGESASVIAFSGILICVCLYLQLIFRILALISTLRTRM